MPGYDAESRYFASTAVLLNELIKLAVCLIISIREQGIKTTWTEVFSGDCWKLAVPAVLYTIQNSLQYTAVSNLDAATFQVTYQLKILTTAFFSVTMLRRSLSKYQWISLLLLTSGIALVQFPADSFNELLSLVSDTFSSVTGLAITESDGKTEGKRGLYVRADDKDAVAELDGTASMNRTVGLVAVVIACFLSGLAGVYFEKVLKGSKASLWIRNIQLSFFSVFPALFVGVLWIDGAKIRDHGFFHGYNSVVWTAIGFQAFGGIVVALCVKFADNIAKNFATSISILISFLASVYFFDFAVTVNFVLGSSVVIFATYLYSRPSPPTGAKPLLPQTAGDEDEVTDNNKRE